LWWPVFSEVDATIEGTYTASHVQRVSSIDDKPRSQPGAGLERSSSQPDSRLVVSFGTEQPQEATGCQEGAHHCLEAYHTRSPQSAAPTVSGCQHCGCVVGPIRHHNACCRLPAWATTHAHHGHRIAVARRPRTEHANFYSRVAECRDAITFI
jgi:hypothetical protein